jgi:hypothetical protein
MGTCGGARLGKGGEWEGGWSAALQGSCGGVDLRATVRGCGGGAEGALLRQPAHTNRGGKVGDTGAGLLALNTKMMEIRRDNFIE